MAEDPRGALCFFLRAGEAEAAGEFYAATLPDSEILQKVKPDPDQPALMVLMEIAGLPVQLLGGNPDFVSSWATSICIPTMDQAETDRLWAALAEGGTPGQCGWITDRFGLYWQIVPEALPRLMNTPDPEARARVQAAMMTMGKIDIATLEAAAMGG